VADDDYELLPHEEIERLKREIDRLKRNPQSGAESTGVDNLNDSINSLLKVFREAAEDMKLDEHDSVMISDKIGPLSEKIDKVLEQNEKIAKGIVAIADMIEDLSSRQRMAPKPPMRDQPRESSIPPAPPSPPSMPMQSSLDLGPQQFSQPQYSPPSFSQPPSFNQPSQPSFNQLPQMPMAEPEKDKKPLFKIKF